MLIFISVLLSVFTLTFIYMIFVINNALKVINNNIKKVPEKNQELIEIAKKIIVKHDQLTHGIISELSGKG